MIANRHRDFILIGACCGNNCGPQPGGQWGPVEFFRRIVENPRHPLHGVKTTVVYESWCNGRETNKFEATGKFVQDLEDCVANAVQNGFFPIIVGGDHSCAIGTWRGIQQGHRLGEKELGMLWLDAHMDSHTDTSSHSGAIHGMPVAALTGSGHPALARPVVDASRVAQVGIRSYEPEEVAYSKEHGYASVEFFDTGRKEVDDPEWQQEAISAAVKLITLPTRNIDNPSTEVYLLPWGLSIDLDGLDPKYAPSVACPEQGGLHLGAVLGAIASLNDAEVEMLRGFEVAEFNPTVTGVEDQDTTFQTLSNLILAMIRRIAKHQGR